MRYEQRVKRTFLRSSRTALLAIALVVPLLAGCQSEYDRLLQISVALRNEGGDKKVREALQADPSLEEWNTLLGENLLYVSDNYRTELTSSKDMLYGAVLGSFLYNNPQYDYELVNRLQHQANYCGFLCKSYGMENKNPIDLDPALFDYYKNWGRVWQQSLRAGPNAAAIAERYELFKKRIGPYGPFRFSDIRELIRDDAALQEFLTDDEAAGRWISAHVIQTEDRDSVTERALQLGELSFNPVTFTSLPGLAS
jgi:hypothetical protein